MISVLIFKSVLIPIVKSRFKYYKLEGAFSVQEIGHELTIWVGMIGWRREYYRAPWNFEFRLRMI